MGHVAQTTMRSCNNIYFCVTEHC